MGDNSMNMKKLGLLPKILIAIALGIAIGSFLPAWLVAGLATFSGLFGNFLGFAIPLIIIGFIAPGIGKRGRSPAGRDHGPCLSLHCYRGAVGVLGSDAIVSVYVGGWWSG